MIKWLRDTANIAKKTAGLEEKQEALKKKIEVARSILDRRQVIDRRLTVERRREMIPVTFERRKGMA